MEKLSRGMVVLVMACVLALCVGCSSGASSSASASAASSSNAGSSVASSSAGAIADGEYTIDVTLSGGSGKASVASPAKLVVANGAMTATLVWSSSNYDLMVVDGAEYRPVSTSGKSTFEVPVPALDEDLAIQAETTAMSEPHMIDYTLRFDSSSLK